MDFDVNFWKLRRTQKGVQVALRVLRLGVVSQLNFALRDYFTTGLRYPILQPIVSVQN